MSLGINIKCLPENLIPQQDSVRILVVRALVSLKTWFPESCCGTRFSGRLKLGQQEFSQNPAVEPGFQGD
jgi:hypothetical protein